MYLIISLGGATLSGLDASAPDAAESAASTMSGMATLLIPFMVLMLILLYILGTYPLKLICEKAGYEPGILIWIPVIHVVALLTAAEMSFLWLLLILIPFPGLPLLFVILFCKLCEARDKPAWLGIFIVVPGVNFLLTLYLAFVE